MSATRPPPAGCARGDYQLLDGTAVRSQYRSVSESPDFFPPTPARPTADDTRDLSRESVSCSARASLTIPRAMRALLHFTTLILCCVPAFFRSRNEQAIVELALRQQLATYAQKRSKPRLTPLDRAFWVALSRASSCAETRPTATRPSGSSSSSEYP